MKESKSKEELAKAQKWLNENLHRIEGFGFGAQMLSEYATMRVKEEVEKLKELKAKAKIKGKLKYTLGYPDIVTDEENNHIYDVRGWGNLQYDKDGEETLQARADLLLTLINSIN